MHVQRFTLVCALAFLSAASALAQDPVSIGSTIGKLKFTDIRSLPRTLDDFGKKKAYVLVFTNTSCPVAQRYLPTLNAMEKEYRARDVQFVSVNSSDEDTIISMATQAVRHEMEMPFVKDIDANCARALGIRRVPEAVVLDAEKRLVYRGRIDDQYRLTGVRKEASSHDLKDAIDAVLAGRKVEKSETEVDGCKLTLAKPSKPRDVTFAEHVAPILKKHCWECHQSGGTAPFSLTTYKQAANRADALAKVITDQRMPPWFASHEFGPFSNRRGLSDEERTIVLDWARNRTPEGNAKKVPAPLKAPESKWLIGTPDLLLKSGVQTLPANGDIPYQYAILPHIFLEDTWVQGAQILPDNPRVLHHCNMGFANLAEGFNEANFITGYVPGGEAMTLDDGIAYRIPKGSILALQMHFVTTGKPEKCDVTVGLRFPRVVVQKRLKNMQLTDRKFAIPPGAPAHRVAVSRVLDTDIVGVGLFSHMHLRGKDMTFTAHLPDKKSDTLLVIPNYNFNWQIPYRWEPGKMRLPKGTRLECVAHYDNSAFNPYNPNPKATVRNGPQTHHEMMFGFFFYTSADEALNLRVDPKTGIAQKNGDKKTDAGDPLSKAVKAIDSAPSYRFTVKVGEADSSVDVRFHQGQPLSVSADKIEFFRKGDLLVYKQNDTWQRTRTGTLSDPLRILGASAKVRAIRLPKDQLALLSKLLNSAKKDGSIHTIAFDADTAKLLASTENRDLARSGTARLWLDEQGRLAKYEIAVHVKGVRGNADVDGVVTHTVTLHDVGATQFEVPAGAKKLLE